MAQESLCVGRGSLRVSSSDPASSWRLRFELFNEGISFFSLEAPATPLTFFEWLDQQGIDRSTALQGEGQVVFVSLPASPQAAFYDLSLSYGGSDARVQLGVQQAEAFSRGQDTALEALDLTFTATEGAAELEVEGQVSVNLFGTAIPLKAHLYKTRGLVFRHQKTLNGLAVPEVFSIDPIGSFHISSLEVGVDEACWDQLQLLYHFDQGEGTDILDTSGTGDPLNVVIATPNKVNWLREGIQIKKNALILSRDFAKKLIHASADSQEISIEAWVKPSDPLQGGPARVVSISEDTGRRLITLGHGPNGGENAARKAQYNGRIRSTATDDNGLQSGERSLLTEEGSLTPALTHVVLTRSQDGWERLYLNGVEAAAQQLSGDLSEWENRYHLLLGNEKGGGRPWQGELHQVAIYSRALGAEEISRRYFPRIAIEGQFSIAQAPPPLHVPLDATLELLPTQSRVQLQHAGPLEVRPMLLLEQLALNWTKTAASPEWQLAGGLQASFWETAVPMLATFDESRPAALKFVTPPAEPQPFALPELGTLTFFDLQLTAVDNWQLQSKTNMEYAILPPPSYRDFDLQADFMLLHPAMGMDDEDIFLAGEWLRLSWELYAYKENDTFIFEGSETLNLPFDLELPSLYDPATGSRISDPISLQQESLNMALTLSLKGEGFLLDITSGLSWQDEQGVNQQLLVPAFQLYQPPATQQELLGRALEELQQHAHDLFAEQGKHEADFFVISRNDHPTLSLGQSAKVSVSQKTELPLMFATPTEVDVQSGCISLEQSAGAIAQLHVQAEGKPQAEIDADYAQLWKAISDQGLSFKPGAEALLRLRLAEQLPLAYDSLLRYYYGLHTQPSGNYVDLQAGMRLRVDFQQYQYVRSLRENAQSGFVGNGSTYLYLHEQSRLLNDGSRSQVLSFDPFLGELVTNVGERLTDGAGGALDLQNTGYRKPYFRLLYPAQFSAESSSVNAQQQVTLLGADSYGQLEEATERFLSSGVIPFSTPSFYFHGKAAVVPEIMVFVREQPVYVSLGTTLRQLLQRYGHSGQAGLASADLHALLNHHRPLRLVHQGAENLPSYRFLHFPQTETPTQGMDSLDLPLVKGDRFYL